MLARILEPLHMLGLADSHSDHLHDIPFMVEVSDGRCTPPSLVPRQVGSGYEIKPLHKQ